MLQATKPQSCTSREPPKFSKRIQANLSFIPKQEIPSKFIKLRPRSQSYVSNNFSFNKKSKEPQTPTTAINQDYSQYQSLFLINDSISCQKQTRKTSLEKSFKEESEVRKIDNLLDTPSLIIDLQPMTSQQQSTVQNKSRGIKQKRGKKEYSPINKLMELYTSRKGRLCLLSKEIYKK